MYTPSPSRGSPELLLGTPASPVPDPPDLDDPGAEPLDQHDRERNTPRESPPADTLYCVGSLNSCQVVEVLK